jgi:hypothetical protein
MLELLDSGIVLVALLGLMLLAIEVGRRIGQKRLRDDPEGAQSGVGAIEGAVFALMGLMIAFTFSGASSRFDARRDLLLQESNAIGTAWLRLDLLPPEVRALEQADFRRYTELRLAATRASATQATPELSRLEQSIWERAVKVAREAPDVRVAANVLPAINEMFDVAGARYLAVQTHPPGMIYGLLVLLALGCAALAGHGMAGGKRRSHLHILGFALSLLLAIYVSIELEFPRHGLVRLDKYDQVLVRLLEGMR